MPAYNVKCKYMFPKKMYQYKTTSMKAYKTCHTLENPYAPLHITQTLSTIDDIIMTKMCPAMQNFKFCSGIFLQWLILF